ncbi:hypothetical protein NDU88_006435 [Pleurodeles waltl]|uniref:Uncharacterized protein n=1 Tax=Pleurodeles waltl TaxID=8319 RepID=A0AAV7WET6_PLEWA|nr:hypothetical protein NDU88_006435 [Pleurodeles waltl]
MEDIKEDNIGRVLLSVRGSLPFWGSLPLSPMGRVAIAKILILPRFLCYFAVLPVALPRSFFKPQQSIVTEILWGKDRYCVALTTTQYPQVNGGLGMPNFEMYYTAAQLQWPVAWVGECHTAERKVLMDTLAPTPMLAWLLDKSCPMPRGNIILDTAKTCWLRYVQGRGPRAPYSPLIPLAHLPRARDLLMHPNMVPWQEVGLENVGDFYSDTTLLTFGELMENTGIHAGAFLTYCTIQHSLSITWGAGDDEPPTSQILTSILSIGAPGE